MRARRLVVATVLLATACGRAEDVPPGPTATPDGRAAASAATLSATVFADQPGCSAAVGIDGKVAWAGARGLADTGTRAPLTPATVFDVGSVAKQFTATAVLLLAQDGRLTVDDPLSRHLDGLPAWLGRITVSQLIHHTSGVPEYAELLHARGYAFTERTTQEQAVRALAGRPGPQFTAGSRFEYTNSNYVLLAEVVRAAGGTPLPRFLADRVFGPLDLAMVVDPVGTIPGKATSYADGSRLDWPWEQLGDGAVQTTPSELVRWADNYRTGRVGGRALLDAQVADPVPVERGVRYAAGIMVQPDGGVAHDGAWAGYRTAFQISPDRRTAAAVACNAAERAPAPVAAQLREIWS